ncbi:hypothetical protein ACOSQ4_029641 [Xanthoceras sorbifolium]
MAMAMVTAPTTSRGIPKGVTGECRLAWEIIGSSEAVHEIPSGYLFQAQVPSKVQLLSAPIEQVVLDPPQMKTLQNAVTSPSSPRSMGTVAVPFVIEKGKGVASSDLIIDLFTVKSAYWLASQNPLLAGSSSAAALSSW